MMTLQYANRAKGIVNTPKINEESKELAGRDMLITEMAEKEKIWEEKNVSYIYNNVL
jgi:hypothetical protein